MRHKGVLGGPSGVHLGAKGDTGNHIRGVAAVAPAGERPLGFGKDSAIGLATGHSSKDTQFHRLPAAKRSFLQS